MGKGGEVDGKGGTGRWERWVERGVDWEKG